MNPWIVAWAVVSCGTYAVGFITKHDTLVVVGGLLLFSPVLVVIGAALLPVYWGVEETAIKVVRFRLLARAIAAAAFLFAMYLVIFVLGGE